MTTATPLVQPAQPSRSASLINKPYDAATRRLIELGPAEWLRFIHVPVEDPERLVIINSDLSDLAAEVDHAILIDVREPWIEHIELQANHDPELPDRIHWYSTVLRRKHRIPVHSTVILLRPEADRHPLSGLHELNNRSGKTYIRFYYDVVRVWQLPVDEILNAGLSLLPLAPVADVGKDRLPELLLKLAERVNSESSSTNREILWATTKILLGLKFQQHELDQMVGGLMSTLLGIRGIEESSVYQEILAKGLQQGLQQGLEQGAVEAAQALILRIGTKLLGAPDPSVASRIRAIQNQPELERLSLQILDAKNWNELLEPATGNP